MKCCSENADELRTWALAQEENSPSDCSSCQPNAEVPSTSDSTHLTKLERNILSLVLEIATCHLEEDQAAYDLDVGTVARCLAKTPAQLSAAMLRLIQDGLVCVTAPLQPGKAPPTHIGLLPTVRSMQTLPFYHDLETAQIESELQKLL